MNTAVDHLDGKSPAAEHPLSDGTIEVAGVVKVRLFKRGICLFFRDASILYLPKRVREENDRERAQFGCR